MSAKHLAEIEVKIEVKSVLLYYYVWMREYAAHENQ